MLWLLRRIWRSLRAEIVFGFLIGSVFWTGILGWQSAYAPTDAQKQECYESARKAGHKSEECKSFWEKSTSDPVALFTLVLAVSTVGLWVATGLLYSAGERQYRHMRRSAATQFRQTDESIALTRQAFIAERRTWLKVWPASAQITDRAGNVSCTVDLIAKNVGPSSAQFVKFGLAQCQNNTSTAGEPQRDALVEQTIRFAEAGSGGVILMADEETTNVYNINAILPLWLEPPAQTEIKRETSEGNQILVLSITFCVVYKTHPIEGWCYTSGIANLRVETGSSVPGDFRHIETKNVAIAVLPSYGKMS
jgi:hypothetical protein